MKRVTVIGAGNGGMTAAYHLSKNGYAVCLYDSPEFDAQIRAVQQRGGIEAVAEAHGDPMILAGFEPVARATTDIAEAVAWADWMVMVCPSYAQEILFARMLPHLRDGQLLVTMPGNYASLVFSRMVKQSPRRGLELTFADAISIPWGTRLVGPAQLGIMGMKKFLPLSVYPAARSTPALQRQLEELLPVPVELLPSPLAAGLENINFGGHPLMTAVNIGLLENFNGAFNYYVDCCSPATARAAEKIDAERLAVGEALGLSLRTELEAMNALYGAHCESVYEFNRSSGTHTKMKSAPKSPRDRYIAEDVPYLFVPCAALGRAVGRPALLVEAVIRLAGAYNGEDYFATGRTLEKMGLAGLSAEQLGRRARGEQD